VLHKTKDENHGVNVLRNTADGDYTAFAVQRNGDDFEYWYTIGKSFTTVNIALKYSKISLAKHGYSL
jgi:hypothetical protein